jgi:hypothetical protein
MVFLVVVQTFPCVDDGGTFVVVVVVVAVFAAVVIVLVRSRSRRSFIIIFCDIHVDCSGANKDDDDDDDDDDVVVAVAVAVVVVGVSLLFLSHIALTSSTDELLRYYSVISSISSISNSKKVLCSVVRYQGMRESISEHQQQ